MTYEWEEKAKRAALSKQRPSLGKGLRVVGYVVANEDTGEGALIRLDTYSEGDVPAADVWQDAEGDARREYRDVFYEVFREAYRE